jgi:hypothetical protein
MALVGWGAPFLYPDTALMNLAAAPNPQTFDAITDTYNIIFRIPASGNIDNIHYRVSTSTTPNLTLSVSVQTVDPATGLPTGTNYKGHTTVTSVNPTTGNKVANVGIVGAVAGDEVSLDFGITAYTSGLIALLVGWSGSGAAQAKPAYPYAIANTAAANVFATLNSSAHEFALEYADGAYFPCVGGREMGMLVGTQTSNAVTNSGTTRRANIIRPPTACRCIGVWCQANIGGGVSLVLRDALTDAVLATATPDKDVRGIATVDTYFYPWDAGATVNLVGGTDYYISFEGTDATGGTLYQMTNIPAVAQLDGISGGQNCYGFNYAGSWVAANTTRNQLGLILDQFDNGAGGGGGGTEFVTGTMMRGMVG